MAFWWVNQNQTWRNEIFGGYLWSPKLDAKGRRSHYYDNMTQIRQGDVVLSHFNEALQYAGVAAGSARSSRKPDFGFKGGCLSREGNDLKAAKSLNLYRQHYVPLVASRWFRTILLSGALLAMLDAEFMDQF